VIVKNFVKKRGLLFFLITATLIGSFFRFYNLNWDSGYLFHPDERNIANAVVKINFFKQLNPEFFAYGGFPIYLYRATADILNFFTHKSSWISSWGDINVIGRFYSALFSSFTILPLFFLAKDLGGRKIALLSVTVYAFSVGSIQTAHYAVTESLITLVVVLVTYFSLQIIKKVTLRTTLILGLIIGVGAASKITALSFIIIPLSAFFLSVLRKKQIINTFLHLIILVVVAIFTYVIFSPYSILSWGKFLESMKYESGVSTGSLPVVYTLQFDKTIPYLFQLKNLFWQMGIIAFFAEIGFLFVILKTIFKKEKKLFVFVIFPLIYFLYASSWHTKFIRYMVPTIPFFIISAAILLEEIKLKYRLFGKILITFAVVSSILWTLAFFSIYTRGQTRITASKWIYQNIPAGSKILTEHWDDGLPVSISNVPPRTYNIEQLTIYDNENGPKAEYYGTKLANADYIVINSRRLYGTLINLPEKYPITSRYYKLLFAEKLGYKKVAQFTSYPSLFGVEVNDDKSEETFQVYDHPKVIILKNAERLDKNKIRILLNNG